MQICMGKDAVRKRVIKNINSFGNFFINIINILRNLIKIIVSGYFTYLSLLKFHKPNTFLFFLNISFLALYKRLFLVGHQNPLRFHVGQIPAYVE